MFVELVEVKKVGTSLSKLACRDHYLTSGTLAVYSQDYNNYTANNAPADEMAALADTLDSIDQRLDAF